VKAKRAKNDESETSNSTGVWPPEVAIQRVAWNMGNGLGGAPLLASTTGSGLCRVDWLLGRWLRDKVPYVNVPNMRKDNNDVMDEDSGED
jgi:transcription factor C subunit 6